jgi:hypothetical protein
MVAAAIAAGGMLFGCTQPPAAATKPTPEFAIGGGACLVGSLGLVTVETTPVNQSGTHIPTGQVTLVVDGVSVQTQTLAPDPVDGTSNMATFTAFGCPTAGQHTYSVSYNGDSVYHSATQSGYDLLAIPPAPDMEADVSAGVINIGGAGCGQDATVTIFAGAPGDPSPPVVALAEADVSSSFYWFTKVQLTPGSYAIQANCPDPSNATLTYNPVFVTVL